MIETGFAARGQTLMGNHAESFAFRAACASGAMGVRFSQAPGSRGDFLQALQLLGAGPTIRRLHQRRARWTVPVHVSCAYEVWTRIFGPPAVIEDCGNAPLRHLFQRWKHFCSNGPITCTGHLFEQKPGTRWVVVLSVSLL